MKKIISFLVYLFGTMTVVFQIVNVIIVTYVFSTQSTSEFSNYIVLICGLGSIFTFWYMTNIVTSDVEIWLQKMLKR
jgi:hypothetical protein